jgi:hypothetical protein
MKKQVTRQRPLLHDGPDWQQLDEKLRQQLVQRLADMCQRIVREPSPRPLPYDLEPPHDARKD